MTESEAAHVETLCSLCAQTHTQLFIVFAHLHMTPELVGLSLLNAVVQQLQLHTHTGCRGQKINNTYSTCAHKLPTLILYMQTPPTRSVSVMSYYPHTTPHTQTHTHILVLIFQPLMAPTPSISLAPIISLLLIHIPSSACTTREPLLDNFQGHL